MPALEGIQKVRAVVDGRGTHFFIPLALALSHKGNGVKLSLWVIARLVCRWLKPSATINSLSGADLQAAGAGGRPSGAFEGSRGIHSPASKEAMGRFPL